MKILAVLCIVPKFENLKILKKIFPLKNKNDGILKMFISKKYYALIIFLRVIQLSGGKGRIPRYLRSGSDVKIVK